MSGDITAQMVRELLWYDAASGLFYRRLKSGEVQQRTPAGTVNKISGYALVSVNAKQYYSHRLVWLYLHGEWPRGCIDHIDGNRTNNRPENLRDATLVVNAQNLRRASRRNVSGYLGVMPSLSKWQAQININGVQTYLGTFETAQLAHAAYLEAKRKHHEGCTI